MEAVAAHRLAAVAALLCALIAVPAARGDGDPASDVLVSQGAFLPYSLKIPQSSRDELTKTVADARKNGYTVRVAVIAHVFDLGTAGLLLNRPQSYARFLAQELANFNTGWVLTVMPKGYGIFHCTSKRRKGGYSDPCEGARPSAADRRVLASLPPPGDGPEMTAAATTAVRRLAALHGANLDSDGGGSSTAPILGAAGGIVVVAAAVGAVLLVRRRRRATRT